LFKLVVHFLFQKAIDWTVVLVSFHLIIIVVVHHLGVPDGHLQGGVTEQLSKVQRADADAKG
jgi:hypothetical protein